jgi:hypothetical protein
MEPQATPDRTTGLCATCAHVAKIRSDRGSVFYRCRLAGQDPRFPKYPRLPVLSCDGYSGESDESRPLPPMS